MKMGDSLNQLLLLKTSPTHQLYSVDIDKYSIKTTVTSSGSVVRRWLSGIEYIHQGHLDKLVVGLGVQWKPFSNRYRSCAATLQLCVGRRCLVFQIMRADYIPDSLIDFLQEPLYNFVGVWNSWDASMLESYGLDVDPIDIRHIAAQKYHPRFRSVSMSRMAKEILGMKSVEKPYWVGRSDWNAHILSQEQIKYAVLDAFVSFELGRHLEVWEDNAAHSDDSSDSSYYYELRHYHPQYSLYGA